MIKRNEFQAYRKKNNTNSSHYYVKLTVLMLLLSSIGTNAIDSTQKLRGKENDLGSLLPASIADSVIHVPDESGSIGLSTGEEETSHLFHIPHESSMLDDAGFQGEESIDAKSSNVLKNDFLEQAKMASDQGLSKILTSKILTSGKPNGESCAFDEDCKSGRCSSSFKCENKLPISGLKGSSDREPNKNNKIQVSEVLKSKSDFLEKAEMALVSSSSVAVTADRDKTGSGNEMLFNSDLGPISLELDDDGEECGYDIVTNAPSKSPTMNKFTYDDISNGLCAIGRVNEEFAGIPSGNSPQEVMETFAAITNIASVFLPQLSIIGGVLGLIAGFLNGNQKPEEDPMIMYFDEKFAELDSKLDDILNAINGIALQLCLDQWEGDRTLYISNWEASYSKLTQSEDPYQRELGREDLLRQCKDFPPYKYSNQWQEIVLGSTSSFTNCFPEAVTDSANRVLYFRKTYSSKILENVYKAVRYDGICNGLRKQVTESNAKGHGPAARITGAHDPAVHIKKIYDKIVQTEDDMYDKPVSAWGKSSLESKYTTAQTTDANVVMNALKNDFFPDYRYAAVLITKNHDKKDEEFFSFFGDGGDDYGSFQLDTVDKKTVVVFYRERNNRQRLSDLPGFDNCVCGGNTMCNRKNNYNCEYSLCTSPKHQTTENSKRNNKNMHDLYASRGTVLIKTVFEQQLCNYVTPTGGCSGSKWSADSYYAKTQPKASVSYASGNDAIIQSVETPYEGNQDKRSKYKLIYIAGDFQCSDSRQCSSNEFCGSKCSGTAPTPSVSCGGNGNPTCSNNNECKPDFECKNSALYTGSTNFANLLSKGLARTYLQGTGAFMNDDDCDNGSVDGNFTRSSKTCKPAPPPAPCFSSETKVNVHQEGLVPISEIKIGDLVQSKKDGSFSRVYALEKNHFGLSKFYQLITKSGLILELTDRHMIYLKNSPKPIPARDVKVGDILATDDSSDAVSGEVTKIEVIRRNGYYNPLTEDGTIILNNGVVASSFSVARSSSSNFFDGPTGMLHWHTLSHLANAPLRVVCKAWFGFCSEEIFQDENGLHKFVVLLKRASNLPNWAQAIVFPFIFGMGVFFTVLELMYDKAEALLEVASSTGIGVGLLTFSLVTALAVPGLLALRKRYFL